MLLCADYAPMRPGSGAAAARPASRGLFWARHRAIARSAL